MGVSIKIAVISADIDVGTDMDLVFDGYDLPLIQQLHRGAFDFIRYTLSGRGCLYNYYGETDSGMMAGHVGLR